MSGLTPDVMAIAEAQAALDRDTLARLLVEGKAERGDFVASKRMFREDIERRVHMMKVRNGLARPAVNLAIRPKKRKR